MKTVAQKRKSASRLRTFMGFVLYIAIMFLFAFGPSMPELSLKTFYIGIGGLILGATSLIIGVMSSYFEAEYPDEPDT